MVWSMIDFSAGAAFMFFFTAVMIARGPYKLVRRDEVKTGDE